MAALDNDFKNILPAQALLRDQTTHSLVFWFCEALPHLLGADALQRVSTVCMDECGEEWAALHVGVLRSLFPLELVVFPCAFHKITQALDKSSNLGRGGAPTPQCYDKIRECLHDICSYYENMAEAQAAMRCLRGFCAEALGHVVFARFNAFLDRLEKDMDLWGFYAVMRAITMLQKTSNRVEIENAIMKGRAGGRYYIHTYTPMHSRLRSHTRSSFEKTHLHVYTFLLAFSYTYVLRDHTLTHLHLKSCEGCRCSK
jgi:hypothetical protein